MFTPSIVLGVSGAEALPILVPKGEGHCAVGLLANPQALVRVVLKGLRENPKAHVGAGGVAAGVRCKA